MFEGLIFVGIAIAVIAAILLIPARLDPAIRIKEKQEATSDGRTAQERRDIAAMEKGICPDCGSNGTLCTGPSGGMSQNIACDHCHMEFNVHSSFGNGLLGVDRTGKLTPGRARSAFGIDMGHPE